MISIETKEEGYLYNIYHMVKAFYPSAQIEQKVCGDAEYAVRICMEGGCGRVFGLPHAESPGRARHLLDQEVYRYLAGMTGRELPWGMLTGVRPTKIAMQKGKEGVSPQEFGAWIGREFFVSAGKAQLAYEIACRERKILEELDEKEGFSLYVNIPFCPTVCSYCSFSAGPVEKWKDSLEEYLDALCREIAYVGRVSRGRRLNAVYIGGGTPTILEASQLERLFSSIDQSFSREYLLEYTVEAGRPETVTEEKLAAMLRHGVTRISINPQTMQQRTLDLIGRRHRTEDVVRAYRLARDLGFDNINMDLIAGLPGETAADMEDTLEKICRLQPDSLTVHALSIKRAARMGQEKSSLGYIRGLEEQMDDPERMGKEISRMTALAGEAAKEMGMTPYYLYRQKNIAGNFENVGYAKVDKAGIYNILIMEEKQSIAGVGAGASTKILLREPAAVPGSRKKKMTRLLRIENVKNIREYLSRIDEMIERKGEWLWP